MKYILAIDQSTSSTKAYLFDEKGKIAARVGLTHKQIINDKGWVSHNLDEIFDNTVKTAKAVIKSGGIDKNDVVAIALTNQRETAAAWDKSGNPLCDAVVWQCKRAEETLKKLRIDGKSEYIKSKTGLPLSPYFSAAKFAWILENHKEAQKLQEEGKLCLGTIDSYLVYRLSGKFVTEPSNASRTALMDLETCRWDKRICDCFKIEPTSLPEIIFSDGDFGETDFCGFFDKKLPIAAVLGDSQAALVAQNCLKSGDVKATYGTGSSVMLNVGEKPIFSQNGLVTSVGYKLRSETAYVLEGNINYSGAIINWLKKDVGLVKTDEETERLAFIANRNDETYLVPAFSGLGAPYFNSAAKALICGMTRLTGRAEIVRAGLDSIAYQINDVLQLMESELNLPLKSLKADGGAVKNRYLMQFQSDVSDLTVECSKEEALSPTGVAYLAGIKIGAYDEAVFAKNEREVFVPKMDLKERAAKIRGWQEAIKKEIENN